MSSNNNNNNSFISNSDPKKSAFYASFENFNPTIDKLASDLKLAFEKQNHLLDLESSVLNVQIAQLSENPNLHSDLSLISKLNGMLDTLQSINQRRQDIIDRYLKAIQRMDLSKNTQDFIRDDRFTKSKEKKRKFITKGEAEDHHSSSFGGGGMPPQSPAYSHSQQSDNRRKRLRREGAEYGIKYSE